MKKTEKIFKLFNLWDRFWMRTNAPVQMRLFRFCFGILAFFVYLIRSFDLDLFYSDSGIMPVNVFRQFEGMDYRRSIFEFFTGHTALWAFDILFLVSLLLLAFGVLPRLFALIGFILHVSFLHRNLSVAYGADLISTFFLFYLCFADYRPVPLKADMRSMLGSMAFRLLQFQICIIYFYSGLSKLKGMSWWRGEAIWGVITNAQQIRWDITWLSHFPFLIVIATYSSLVWEIYFPVLIWLRPLRYPMLIFGVILHLAIGAVINITFFGLLMIVTYTLYLYDADAKKFAAQLKKFLSLTKVRTPIADKNNV